MTRKRSWSRLQHSSIRHWAKSSVGLEYNQYSTPFSRVGSKSHESPINRLSTAKPKHLRQRYAIILIRSLKLAYSLGIQFILAVEMLANPISNVVEVKAAFAEELSIANLDYLVSRIESHLQSLCRGESNSPLVDSHPDAGTLPHSVNTTGDAQQNEDEVVDLELENSLVAAVASFLNVSESLVAPNSSLVALGLTSLKSVTLSRKLKGSGITVTAIDIIQADTVRGVASKCGRNSGSIGAIQEGRLWLGGLQDEIKKEVSVNEFKLTDKDEPEVMCATALQTGMLSQVRLSRLLAET